MTHDAISGGGAGADELSRIAEAYRRRDAGDAPGWSWSDPAYVAWLQDLEWELLTVLRALGVEPPGASVLDVGCGGGYFTQRLSDFGADRVVGLDLMASRVDAARSTYPALEFVAASASDMPFDDDSFSLVTQFMCLSSVLDEGLRRSICAEMRRVTRPGGAIVSFDLRSRPTLKKAAGLLRRRPLSVEVTPVRPVDPDELERFVGLPAAEVRSVGFPQEAARVVSALPFKRLWAAHFPIPVHALVAIPVR